LPRHLRCPANPRHLSAAPNEPLVASTPVVRIEPHTVEPLAKVSGVRRISKTENLVLRPVRPNGVATRTERQFAAELVRDQIILACHIVGRERDLMRPLAIDPGARKLAFAPAHVTTRRSGEVEIVWHVTKGP